MQTPAHPNQILWPIEPFPRETAHLKLVVQTLRALSVDGIFKIKPISIVGPADLHWPKDLPPESKEMLINTAQVNLANLLGKLELPRSEPTEIDFQSQRSIKESARHLAQRAETQGDRMIVLSTHARPTLKRWILGSFTEALLDVAHVPLLTVNPHVTVPSRFRRILFATDFSVDSAKAFKACLEIAKTLHSEIVIGHRFLVPFVVPVPLYAGPELIFDPRFNLQTASELEKVDREEKTKMAQGWIAMAKDAGLEARLSMKDSVDPLVETLLHMAKEESADMMAVDTRYEHPSGFISSVARDLIRNSELPLLTLPHLH